MTSFGQPVLKISSNRFYFCFNVPTFLKDFFFFEAVYQNHHHRKYSTSPVCTVKKYYDGQACETWCIIYNNWYKIQILNRNRLSEKGPCINFTDQGMAANRFSIEFELRQKTPWWNGPIYPNNIHLRTDFTRFVTRFTDLLSRYFTAP